MSDFVVCINNDGCQNLTVGKKYKVLETGYGWFEVTNDAGFANSYELDCFKVVDEPQIKPPLGLIPRKIYLEKVNHHRINDILDAMKRYCDAEKDIPVEWAKELIDLWRQDNE